LKVSKNIFWVIFVDARAILFILGKLISRNLSWFTELNRDALEFKWVH